jgi:hypothetical protein
MFALKQRLRFLRGLLLLDFLLLGFLHFEAFLFGFRVFFFASGASPFAPGFILQRRIEAFQVIGIITFSARYPIMRIGSASYCENYKKIECESFPE